MQSGRDSVVDVKGDVIHDDGSLNPQALVDISRTVQVEITQQVSAVRLLFSTAYIFRTLSIGSDTYFEGILSWLSFSAQGDYRGNDSSEKRNLQ